MNQGQRRVLDAIIIFAVLLIILSGWFQQFWAALFSKNNAALNLNPFSGVTVTGPGISVPGLTVTPGTITVPADTQTPANPTPATVPTGTNTQPVAPTPPLVTGTVGEPENVANAVADTGSTAWLKNIGGTIVDYCEQFVENVSGLGIQGTTAFNAWTGWLSRGEAVAGGNPANAPAGSLVYFSGGGAGHAGVALGGGNFSSSLYGSGITSESVATFLSQNPGYSYLGYVPPVAVGPGATTIVQGNPGGVAV